MHCSNQIFDSVLIKPAYMRNLVIGEIKGAIKSTLVGRFDCTHWTFDRKEITPFSCRKWPPISRVKILDWVDQRSEAWQGVCLSGMWNGPLCDPDEVAPVPTRVLRRSDQMLGHGLVTCSDWMRALHQGEAFLDKSKNEKTSTNSVAK